MTTTIEKDFFVSLDREGFVRWLWAGISTLYTENNYRGFSPRFLIGQMNSESYLDDLEKVYRESVPARQQLLFRQAIGDILEAQKDDQEDAFRGIDDLLYLASRINAIEAMESIVHAVGFGLAAKKAEHLVYDGIANLKLFPASPELRAAMITLIEAPNFSDRYIFDIAQFLSSKNLITEGDGVMFILIKHMDALYRKSATLGKRFTHLVKEEAAKIPWYKIPE